MNPLQILTSDIPPQGIDIHWEKKGQELGLTGKLTPLAAVKIQGRITPRDSIFFFQGTVETVMDLSCSRCLKKIASPIKAVFTINYEPVVFEPENASEEIELGHEDLDISYFANHVLPVGEDLREAILLALPPVPLCREDCRGLCPDCGQDLNESACDCETQEIDARWQDLAELKKKLEEK